MACFASFVSAQNNQQAPPEKSKTEKEAEKGDEKKTTPNEAPGTPNQPSENPQNLSDGTKRATIVKAEPKKEKGNN